MALNLEKQLRFYGAYHHNPVNIAIHISCVPVLLWTGFLLGTNSPTLIPLPPKMTPPNLDLNLGTIACLAYCALYVLLEPVAGTALSVLLIIGTAFAKHLTSTYSPMVSYVAAGVHVVSWIAQFIGHGKFEGRAPALLDNIFQAFFLAPLFVWLEVLFSMGYREELKNRVDEGVQQDIAKFKASQTKANGNGTANGHLKSS